LILDPRVTKVTLEECYYALMGGQVPYPQSIFPLRRFTIGKLTPGLLPVKVTTEIIIVIPPIIWLRF